MAKDGSQPLIGFNVRPLHLDRRQRDFEFSDIFKPKLSSLTSVIVVVNHSIKFVSAEIKQQKFRK